MTKPRVFVPEVVATAGLHGSASTWIFNIVRELMARALGSAPLLTFYADELSLFPPEATAGGRHFLFKSHHGSAGLDAWIAERQVPVLLTLRDPRDAATSMALRFRAPLSQTIQWLERDCRRFTALAARGYPVFRYEERFFEQPDAVAAVATHLGLPCDAETGATLFARYETEAVRAFARNLNALPSERLTQVGVHQMDRVTQILGPHIGDARSGKWRNLPASLQAEMTRIFAPFLERFGYSS
ncbi:hypothetical protein [Acidisoma sp. 7E03]